MAGRERSESLFGDSSTSSNVPHKTQLTPGLTKEDIEAARESAKKDYIFKHELKEVFEERVQGAQGVESAENIGVIKQINRIQEHVISQENALLKIANQRRKRHYALNGDVKVYCYIKNEWPKLIVRPLTIQMSDFPIIPSLGPFNGKGEMLLEVTFRPITVGVKKRIDPFIYEPVSDTSDQLSINSDEYRKLAFFCCFKSWNIPIVLPFSNDGILDESAFKIIEKEIHPILFDVVSSEFIGLNDISGREMDLLDQQCERLFGKNSKGISNPLEGIKLYCEASVFAKEFSLSGRNLDELPIRISSMIRHVANKGGEIHSKELDANKNKPNKRAKVIGSRGRR